MIYLFSILAITFTIIWGTYATVRDLIKSSDKKLFNPGVAIIAGLWIGGGRLIFILIEKFLS
jgi:hypothetical protein